MNTTRSRRLIRTATLIAVFGLIWGAVQVCDSPLAAPALAKGVAPAEDESNDTRSTEEKRETRPSTVTESSSQRQPESRSETTPEPRSSTRTTQPPTVERRTETEKEPRAGVQPKTATPDVTGQIRKRSEERDPEYEFRRHYQEPFFYPYDYQLYRNFPGPSRPAIIVVPDTRTEYGHGWRSRYGHPGLGSLDEALMDIEAVWWDRDAKYLMWHIPASGYVNVYEDGRYSHRLSSREMYNLTLEALSRIRTVDFRFTSVDKHTFRATARARHTYLGPDRKERTAQLTYYLEKVTNRWYITRMDISGPSYGVARCFIATAAYGTPMAQEVLVLREFRERVLLRFVAGKLFVAGYYAISPPIASAIEESPTAKSAVRFLLAPVVYTCRLLLPAAAN